MSRQYNRMNSVSLPALRVLILAAGFSSRLGEPKALARVHGISLLRKALQLVANLGPAGIIAVVPRNAARYRIEARGIHVVFKDNSQRTQGLSSSVRRGITAARYSPALLLLPVDLVNLRRRDLMRLISSWRGARRRVTARRIGRQGGAPLILPRRLYPRSLELQGDIGLREMLNALPREAVRFVDMPSARLDIDTPRDLQAARRRFQGVE
jgi:molybdenum cofactor cytidylyltransferase